jgi:hypothetical protein
MKRIGTEENVAAANLTKYSLLIRALMQFLVLGIEILHVPLYPISLLLSAYGIR